MDLKLTNSKVINQSGLLHGGHRPILDGLWIFPRLNLYPCPTLNFIVFVLIRVTEGLNNIVSGDSEVKCSHRIKSVPSLCNLAGMG